MEKLKYEKPKLFRRKYLIDRKFQLSLLGLLTLPAFMSWGVFYAGYRLVINPMFTQALGIDANTNREIQALQIQLKTNFDTYFLWSLAISLFFVTVLGVVITNRLAGPIYRLKRYLMGLEPGGPLRFRKDDFLSDLPDLLNDFNLKNGKKSKSNDPKDPTDSE